MPRELIARLITPPIFENDSTKTREAQTLYNYLGIHSIIILITIPFAIILSTSKIIAVTILLILLLVHLLALEAMQRGYVRFATLAYIGFAWFNSAVFILLTGNRADTAALFFPVIAMATLFLGIRAGIISTLLALVYSFILMMLGETILSPLNILILNDFTQWFVLMSTAMVLLIPLALKYRELTETLSKARKQLKELRDVQEGLRESEERFRLISTVTSDYTFSSRYGEDGQLDHLLLTGAFETITGYHPDEFSEIGGWQATIHPDDRVQDARDLEKLRQNKPVESQIRIIHKSGDIRWTQIYAVPVWDDKNNRLIAINGGVKDITARKRAENVQRILFDISKARVQTDNLYTLLQYIHNRMKPLMPAENFYVALYDEATEMYTFPYGVDLEDDNWQPSELNNSLTDYVRRTGESVIVNEKTHEQMKQKYNIEDIGVWAPVWIGAPLKTSRGIFGVIALQDYNNEDAYSQTDLDILTYISENIASVIESKRQEEELQTYADNLEQLVNERTNALRLANEQFELILNTTSDALAFANPNGDILITNPAFASLFGDDVVQSLEHILKCLEDEKHVAVFSEALLDTIQNNANQRVEAQVSASPDRIKDIDIELLPVIETTDPSKRGILLSGRDITHVKEIDRFKTQFVADAVHDLATPISGLSTRLYLLKRSPEKLTEHISSLESQVDHLRHLLEDLRTMSHVDQNRLTLNKRNINLNALVQHVFDTYDPVASDNNQTIILALAPDLPSINADERQIERVLVNLVSNAINYTPENKSITIITTTDEQSVILSVQDEGMGMSADELPRIFERFYRTDSARSNREGGTGLGLAITKNIIELHGGTIDAQQEGKGSTFTVMLPL